MKRGSKVLLAGLISALCVGTLRTGALAADGLLGQELGGAAGPGAPVAPSPPQKAPDGPAPGPALVDPDAARVVDDMDLLKKLTGGAADEQKNQTGAAQQLQDMVSRMGESEQRLGKSDPGTVTQETQRRIVVDLDALIEIARKQSSSKGQSKQPGQGQQRQQTQTGRGQGGATAATSEQLRDGGYDPAASNGQDMHQKSPAEWGNLPDRDRDLLAHGSNEQYLPAYKALIDRYYQALAEMGRSTRGQ